MRRKRLLLPAALVGVMLLAAGCALLGMAAVPQSLATRRAAGIQRWQARAPQSYRVMVQVGFNGRFCLQEIEVHGPRSAILHDTCGTAWLSTLAVPRLFELGERLEHPAECFPSSRNCICQRARVGSVDYDPQLGFPSMISWRRELRPNWLSPAYLGQLLETRALPTCASATLPLSLMVVSLTPLR